MKDAYYTQYVLMNEERIPWERDSIEPFYTAEPWIDDSTEHYTVNTVFYPLFMIRQSANIDGQVQGIGR